jgi:hypothetical protein
MPDCRYCGEPGAYDSGFTVECCNKACEWYHHPQLYRRIEEDGRRELLRKYLSEESTDPDITPTFHWGIDTTLDEGLD